VRKYFLFPSTNSGERRLSYKHVPTDCPVWSPERAVPSSLAGSYLTQSVTITPCMQSLVGVVRRSPVIVSDIRRSFPVAFFLPLKLSRAVRLIGRDARGQWQLCIDTAASDRDIKCAKRRHRLNCGLYVLTCAKCCCVAIESIDYRLVNTDSDSNGLPRTLAN